MQRRIRRWRISRRSADRHVRGMGKDSRITEAAQQKLVTRAVQLTRLSWLGGIKRQQSKVCKEWIMTLAWRAPCCFPSTKGQVRRRLLPQGCSHGARRCCSPSALDCVGKGQGSRLSWVLGAWVVQAQLSRDSSSSWANSRSSSRHRGSRGSKGNPPRLASATWWLLASCGASPSTPCSPTLIKAARTAAALRVFLQPQPVPLPCLPQGFMQDPRQVVAGQCLVDCLLTWRASAQAVQAGLPCLSSL